MGEDKDRRHVRSRPLSGLFFSQLSCACALPLTSLSLSFVAYCCCFSLTGSQFLSLLPLQIEIAHKLGLPVSRASPGRVVNAYKLPGGGPKIKNENLDKIGSNLKKYHNQV